MRVRDGWARSIALALLLCLCRLQVQAQELPSELEVIYQRGLQLYEAGKFAETVPIAEEYISVAAAKYGEQHPLYATGLGYLGVLYSALNRPFEAEPLFKRALAIKEKSLGPDHKGVADALHDLAECYRKQGRSSDAEPLYQRTLSIVERALGPDHASIAVVLGNLAELYRAHHRHAEAEPLYKRALGIAEKELGLEHYAVSTVLGNLGELYLSQGRYAEAEPLLKRSLAIREKALGLEHHEVAEALRKLGRLYMAMGRHDEARAVSVRSNEITAKVLGPEHKHLIDQSMIEVADLNLQVLALARAGKFVDALALAERHVANAEARHRTGDTDSARAYASALNNLASLHLELVRYAEAELLFKRALVVGESELGPDHISLGSPLNNLASLYKELGRYADAEPLFKRSLAIQEKALGAEHPEVGLLLDNLAQLRSDQGRDTEAEPLYRRSLAIRERTLGLDDPAVGRSLNNLAQVYRAQGRYDESERLYARALSISEKTLGVEHLGVAALLNNIGVLHTLQRRYAEAELRLRRALAIEEKALGDHPVVAGSLDSLAELYRVTGRGKEAESLYERSLAIREKALGANHRNVAQSLNNLALLYEARREYAKAEQHFERSLAIAERMLGPDHDEVGRTLNNLAHLHFAQQQWTRASDYFRKSADLAIRRKKLGTTPSSVLTGEGASEAERESERFWALVKASYRLTESAATRQRVLGEMFKTAQWARASEAATSLAQMAARQAKGNGGLAQLVRERQDLVGERQMPEKLLIWAVSQMPDKRNAAAEQEQRTRIATIDARIAEIDIALAKDFPDYAALASPEPLTIAETQTLLRPDETLVLFLDTPGALSTPEETFVWVVSNAESRWVRVDLGTKALTEEVAALRCGVDRSAWYGEGALLCAKRLNIELDKAPKSGDSLPFDLTRAHELYRALFVPVEDLIKGKDLLIVASGPLSQIPFHVLVTEKPNSAVTSAEAFRRGAWLAKSNAITVLPSVSSLKALRVHAKTSHATKPFVGFGNPLLDGPDHRFGVQAELARAKQQCSKALRQSVAGSTFSGGMRPLQQRGELAEVASVRTQVPLPETADELCAVARDLGVPDSEIWLGARANERFVKQLSDSRELASYRIVHFATHGALAGELNAGAEPGLILTPPGEATPEDDGYLSASEVAHLKLDADWVILSACNTAAGATESAEALSGMSRAFFYAGARALLVSHWAVNSDTTVKLITKTLSTMAADKSIGRSEALRRSMVALIEHGELQESHPAFWAPFVVVGEGGPTDAIGQRAIVAAPTQAKKSARKLRLNASEHWTVDIWKGQ